jgi:hypothetical protein
MAPERTCGTCTLCCKVMGIVELEKPPDRWCAHCKPGQGCDIYETRPTSCRTFVCGWLTDPTMPAEMRPDRTKVVLYADANGRLVAQCDPAQPLAWRKEPTYGLLRRWAETARARGTLVTVVVGERLWVVTPAGEIDLGAVPPDTPLALLQRPDGRYEVKVGRRPG